MPGLLHLVFAVASHRYVSQEEAGKRLAKVVADPTYNVSSAYWSWKEGSDGFVNEVSLMRGACVNLTLLVTYAQKHSDQHALFFPLRCVHDALL